MWADLCLALSNSWNAGGLSYLKILRWKNRDKNPRTPKQPSLGQKKWLRKEKYFSTKPSVDRKQKISLSSWQKNLFLQKYSWRTFTASSFVLLQGVPPPCFFCVYSIQEKREHTNIKGNIYTAKKMQKNPLGFWEKTYNIG